MRRTTSKAGLVVMLVGAMTLGVARDSSAPPARSGAAGAAPAVFMPALTWQQVSAGDAPPTAADCYSFGNRCFVPQSMANAYNYAVLHAAGHQGQGVTIAIIDAFGSDTIAHDLHVFNQAFGLSPMCGEEAVTCAPGMPRFDILALQGSPAKPGAPPTSRGTFLQDPGSWAFETSLDVEWAHATAPRANILLVTTPTAETQGVQGFPPMMSALQYVIDHDLADVVSMSLGASEGSFHGGLAALVQLRKPLIDAQQARVTVLASTADFGTTGLLKEPPKNPGLLPYPAVYWPASDPLVTAVGGTRLCMDAVTGLAVDFVDPPDVCMPPINPGQRETGWVGSGGGYSILFARPGFQNVLPPGSTFVGSSAGAPPPNANMRGIPDIAYQASPGTNVLIALDSNWFMVGGTSAGTPQWAGLVALADEIAQRRLGHINPALYAIASNPARYASDFFDVTVGCNQVTDVPGYCASPGWDAVTGLGTPNAANLLPDLVAASP